MKISVVTSTYNREKEIHKLYESLKDNYKSFKDFEWIIMDDGSIDNTKKLINKWISVSKFKIDYHYNENMGKQKEINEAMKYVTGDVVIEVDSDDYLITDALKTISIDYEMLDDKAYGLIYKNKLGEKNIDTLQIDSDNVVSLFDIHNKYNYDFDMHLIIKSDIRKKYLYELESDEKFITESRLYYKLDQLYNGLYFKDKIIAVCEYQTDGYSKNINKIFKKYPKGYLKYFNECLTYIKKDTLFRRKLYFIKHYILFSYLNKVSIFKCIKNANKYKLIIALLVIPGYIKSRKF